MNKPIFKWFSMLLLLMVSTISATAQTIALADFSIMAGETKDVAITVSEAVYGIQTDVTLSEGLTLEGAASAQEGISLTMNETNKRMAMLSTSGAQIAAGKAITLSVKAANEFTEGTITLGNTYITIDNKGTEVTPANVTANVTLDKTPEPNAEINKVQLLGEWGNWNSGDGNLTLTKGDGDAWTGVLDLSEVTTDQEFKLVINDNVWIGNGSTLVIDAPENWVTGLETGQWNYKLANATTGYQTYNITATWVANPQAADGWTLKIEGKDERPEIVLNTYTATFTTDVWEEVYAYAWSGKDERLTEFLGDWPGTKLEKNAETGLYDVTITAEAAPEFIIFNNGNSGAGNQTDDLAFVDKQEYSYTAPVFEPIIADGSYYVMSAIEGKNINGYSLLDHDGKPLAFTFDATTGTYTIEGAEFFAGKQWTIEGEFVYTISTVVDNAKKYVAVNATSGLTLIDTANDDSQWAFMYPANWENEVMSYIVAGTEDLTGSSWQLDAANKMVRNSESGLFEWKAEKIAVSNDVKPEFKVVASREEGNVWYPGDNWIITPDVTGGEGVFDITITFDPSTKDIRVAAEKAETPQPEYTSTATYAVQVGETHKAGETVDVKDADEDVVATLTFGFEGGADFKAGVAHGVLAEQGFVAYTEGNGENGAADKGTTYIITPKYDGEITVGVVLNKDKAFYILENEEAMEGFNGIKVAEKLYGTYTFNVAANNTYKVYCTGSKLGFYGFNYSFNKGGDEPPTPEEFKYESVYAVGNGDETWMNNKNWAPGAEENKMTKVSDDVWEITFTGVAAGNERQIKFAIDGTWDRNFGGAFQSFGEETAAVWDGSNITFDTAAETQDITVRLDLTGFDIATKQGAKFTITTTAETPQPTAEYYVAGAPEIVFGEGNNWEVAEENKMTLSGEATAPVYTLTKEVELLGGTQILYKIVKVEGETKTWIPDGENNEATYDIEEDGTYKLTFNYVEGEDHGTLTVETSTPEEFKYESVYAVGNGDETWMNNKNWAPGAEENKMTKVSDDVWEITFTGVAAGNERQIKFAIDGTWDRNFGGAFQSFGEETAAVWDGSNITFDTAAETQDITVRLDLTGFDIATKQGAKFTITTSAVTPPSTTHAVSFVNTPEWEEVYAYAWSGEGETMVEQLGPWPGTKMTKEEANAAKAMVPAEQADVYKVEFTSDIAPEKIIFNNGKLDEAERDQTGDLVFVDNKEYNIEEPVAEDIYTVVGQSEAIFGAPWDVEQEANKMTAGQEENTWTLTKENVQLSRGTYTYKVVKNNWEESYGDPENTEDNQNATFVIDEAGKYNVTFTFNSETKAVNAIPELIESSEQTFTVTFVNTAKWDKVYAYAWTYDAETEITTPFTGAWPGTEISKKEGEGATVTISGEEYDVFELTFKAEAAPEQIIFNNGDGGDGNQTSDLVFENGAQYSYPIEEPVAIWTIAGDEPLMGVSWEPAAEVNDMTSEDNTTWTLTKTDVFLAANNYGYKVVKNHSWNENYGGEVTETNPDGNAILTIGEPGTYTVVFTFNSDTKELSAVATKTADYVINGYNVVGSSVDLFGAEWDVTANQMTKGDGEIYTWTKEKVALTAGDIEYKAAANGEWIVFYPAGAANNTLSIEQDGMYNVTITLDLTGDEPSLTAVAQKWAADPNADYYVVGEESLIATGWTPSESGKMTPNADDTFTMTLTGVQMKSGDTFQYKVTDGNDNWYPEGMDNNLVTDAPVEDGVYSLIFTFDPFTGTTTVTLTRTGDLPTAIMMLQADIENGNAVVYDLRGNRVRNVQRGIYIVNGRKVAIK